MRIHLFVIIFLFGLHTLCGACISAEMDTLIPVGQYNGYRLHITEMKVLSKSASRVKVMYTAINTGKLDLDATKSTPYDDLQITFDYSLLSSGLSEMYDKIFSAIARKKLKLKVGESRSRITHKIDSRYAKMPFTKKEEVAKSETKKEEEKPQKQPIETIEPKPKDTPEKKPAVKNKNEKEDTLVFKKPTFDSRSLEDILEEKNTCPDLVFDTLYIVSQNSREALLRYRISNKGKGPATIYKPGGKKEENLGIRAFLSGTSTITKSAVVIGGDFIQSGLEGSAGILDQGQSFTGSITLDVRQKSRYMKNVVLSLDAFLKLQECDRTNNTRHVLLD